MIWLASFPRSGNTFFRNVLYEVYGLESSTYHIDPDRELDQNYDHFPIVKTHLLPHQVQPADADIPAVYLVRDGRDALVSLAHHRKDIVEPGSNYEHNLLEAVIARGGSHFGGWSENVRAWLDRADIVIRFEDLIQDPIQEAEKLRNIIELPKPRTDRLPDFEKLKHGQPKYGGGASSQFDPQKAKRHFRKGMIGSYQDEMPVGVQKLFWGQHGDMMSRLGYGTSPFESQKKHVLIEGSKFFNQHMDGIGRYVQSMVRFIPIVLSHQQDWEVDLFHKNDIIPVYKAEAERDENPDHLVLEHDYETRLLRLKNSLKKIMPSMLYQPMRELYVRGPWRKFLREIRDMVNKQQVDRLKKDLSEIEKNYDLIHAPVPQGLMKVNMMGGNFLTTVHDTTHKAAPQWHDEANVKETEEGMRVMEDLRSDILAVSESTKADLIDHYDVVPDQVKVVYEGIDPDVFHPRWRDEQQSHLDEKYKLPQGKFILSLSTLEPRKNISGTIRAFQKLKSEHPDVSAHLVIAGRRGWKWKNIMASYEQMKDQIIFTGYVEEEDLPYLYGKANIFCYPSHYEGFGLPLLEAMGCGTPVIYGRNSAMIEIVGESGIGVPPEDHEKIASAMYRLLTDEDHWEKMSLESRKKANQYTWLKCAYHTIEHYEKLIMS